jgi:succinate dehydrogenase / fumarate reductase, cytochrome b subunit
MTAQQPRPRLPQVDVRATRPLSPHLQIYRPQLTSVLSFSHRLSGIVVGICAVVLVALLLAAASGPQSYDALHAFIQSWPGQILLCAGTFAFFLHMCGGIRHLFWDTGRGFELRTIYASGWAVVAMSVTLTAIVWIVRSMLAR